MKLTKRQSLSIKRHRKHHTKKHIDMMTELMSQGKTFTQAHNLTMKKIGK